MKNGRLRRHWARMKVICQKIRFEQNKTAKPLITNSLAVFYLMKSKLRLREKLFIKFKNSR